MRRGILLDKRKEKILKRDGFITMPFLSPTQISSLRKALDRLNRDSEGMQFHSTMHHKDAIYREKVDLIIKEILTKNIANTLENYRVLFANFIVKEPGERSEVGIHQDWSYLDEEQFESVNIWCPLINTHKTNGALHVLKRSHILETSIRFTPYMMPPYEHLYPLIRDNSERLDLRAGEAILYFSRLIHFSNSNQSNQSRPAIGLVSIPQEAQALHYYRDMEKEPNRLQVIAVDSHFFYTIAINEQPNAGKKLTSIPYREKSFSKKDVTKLKRKRWWFF